MIIIAQFFQSSQYIIEEVLLASYQLDPLLIVGTAGMWGLFYYLGLLPLMQNYQCGTGDGPLHLLCNYGYFENSAYAFWQMGQRPVLIVLSILSIMCIAGYNSTGVSVTKYASGTARATIKTACTILVWVLSSTLLGAPWEPWSGVGFFFVAGGTFVYNEIIVIPYWGFDKNTKEAIKARKALEDGEKGEDKKDKEFLVNTVDDTQ